MFKIIHKSQIRRAARLMRRLSTELKAEVGESSEEKFKKSQDKIIYSSYLNQFEQRLGYVGDKIHHERQQKIQTLEKQSQKTFPLALKFLDGGEKLESLDPKPEEEDLVGDVAKKKTFYLPFSQARSILSKENPPANSWMQDYEHYENDFRSHSYHGTPDPSVPVSEVPCSGCGAHLHCANKSLPGYLPSEIFRNRKEAELTKIVCQRCHLLKRYNTAINVTVTPEDYVKVISSIRDKKALAILMVDLLDLENSIWPGIRDILGTQRPIVVVGNKVDLLPRDFPGHLEHVTKCVEKAVMEAGFDEANIKHIGLISAVTKFGVEELITRIHSIWGRKGDVYIVGCTNVGKSSLFNVLLQSDFCKSEASTIIQKATASPWPGTTLNLLKFPILMPSEFRLAMRTKRLVQDANVQKEEEKVRRMQANKTRDIYDATLIGSVGRTFVPSKPQTPDSFGTAYKGNEPQDFIPVVDPDHKLYRESKWCYDTPGVVQPQQILNLLTTEEILKVLPTRMITPSTFLFKPGLTLFVGGLGRIDFLDAQPELKYIRIQVFGSPKLQKTIVRTEDADELYREFLGTRIFEVPDGSEERLAAFPSLKSTDVSIEGMHWSVHSADILLSSAGWVGVSLLENVVANFRVWTPEGRGAVVRRPALIPYGVQLRGKKIRGSLAYRPNKPFISFRK